MKTINKSIVRNIANLAFLIIIVAGNTFAAQTEQAFMVANRYSNGILTGTISPDPDGTGPLKLPAVRNTYNAGLLTAIETGELASWQDEDIQPSAWANFTVYKKQVFEYDDYGRKSVATLYNNTNQKLSVTEYSYDDHSRVLCSAIRMNLATNGSACTSSNLTGDNPDRISRFTYDDFDHVTTEERAVGTTLQQNYVSNVYTGNALRYQVDANCNTTEIRYNNNKQASRTVYPSTTAALVTGQTCNKPTTVNTLPSNAGSVNESDYVEVTYDTNGNVLTERKRNGTLATNTYDNNNRVVFKDYSSNTNVKDIAYDYDLRNLQLSAKFVSDTGFGLIYDYDGFGNIKTSSNTLFSTTKTLSYQYDANGNRTQITHPDNNQFTYNFDGINRAKTISDPAAAILVTINYQANGSRLSVVRSNNTTTSYDYTDGVRLDSFSQSFPSSTTNNLQNSFTYNNAGQIASLTRSNNLYYYQGNEDRKGAYLPDGLNRYSKVNGQPFGYDTNSNLTNDGTFVYTYDDENRLLTATSSSTTASFTYAPNGRLFQSTINGTIRQYLYDGDALVAEYASGGTLNRRYVHGDQVDEPLVQYNSTSVSASNRIYFHKDHQGSIIALSDNSGTVTNTLTYDAYGIPGTNNTGRFGYTGQIWFKEIGLDYYKARMYSPKLGRFMQTDPIFYADDMNMYAYTGNDPLNNTDPSGMNNCEVSGSDGTNTPIPNCAGDANASPETGDEKAKRDKVDEIVVTGTRNKAGPNLQDAINSPGEVGFKVDDGSLSSVQLSKTETLNCNNGVQVEKHVINRADIDGADAIGHTHGTDIVSGIGPDDISTAMATGMPAYVAYGSGVSVVEKVGGSYRARVVTGSWGAPGKSGVNRQIKKVNNGGNGKGTQSKGCK